MRLAERHFAPGPKDFESVRQVFAEAGIADVRQMAWGVRVWLPLVQAASDTPAISAAMEPMVSGSLALV